MPFVELDSIRHQAGWTELPDDEFRARVASWLAADDVGGRRQLRARCGRSIVARATDVVWIDPRKAVVMAQVVDPLDRTGP